MCLAPVYETPEDIVDDPHVRARNLVATVPGGPDEQQWHQVRFPVLFDAGLDSHRAPAPALGEHTAEVLAPTGRRS
ncbi:hypothetical protein GTV15_08570 [Streptomyces sp. SID7803]|nr:hypothetical protein [Streptomyces sp. SID7803]